jgi:hypothetical protein
MPNRPKNDINSKSSKENSIEQTQPSGTSKYIDKKD